MNFNFKGVSKETWLRTATLLLALVNQILVSIGFEAFPFEVDELYEIGSSVVTALLAIWAWWRNNSLTEEAQVADEIMHELKAEDKAERKIIEEDEITEE